MDDLKHIHSLVREVRRVPYVIIAVDRVVDVVIRLEAAVEDILLADDAAVVRLAVLVMLAASCTVVRIALRIVILLCQQLSQ